MITISTETWADLHSASANDFQRKLVRDLIKASIAGGIQVWLSDEEGQRIKPFKLLDGDIII